MKVNTGGYLAPNEVIGRDDFISDIWRILDTQSIVLTSERRIGKSSVINKLQTEARKNWLVIKRDVEGISSTEEFVTRLVDDLLTHQSKLTTGMHWLGKIRKEFDDFKILGVTISKRPQKNWVQLLESILNKLATAQSQNNVRALLIWDEFPWMLQKIIKNEGSQTAANLLDNLRQCRQSQQGIRMMLTGSIGLHHVLKTLKHEGLSNESLNDIYKLNLPALSKLDAIHLVKKLVDGEQLQWDNEATLTTLTQAVDCVPYYIHHTVNSHKQKNIVITGDSIQQIIKEAFTSANDPWNLVHYHSRIRDYYAADAPLFELILDELAFSDNGLSRQEIKNGLNSNTNLANDPALLKRANGPEFIRNAIQLLSTDHYLLQNPGTSLFDFNFPLIKAWWRIYRG